MEIETDTNEDKKLKISHNSKHWNMFNCLSLANLYRDVGFYLPTFADFRGRIYTLSTYLSYPGMDISRGLLLFSTCSSSTTNKKTKTVGCAGAPGFPRVPHGSPSPSPIPEEKDNNLTLEGLEFLKVYFANLKGYSKESWNFRILKMD